MAGAETTTVPGVYAAALVEVAKERDQLDLVKDELETIVKALTGDPRVTDFLLTPSISREAKEKAVKAALAGKASETILNFLAMVIRRGRQESLSDIYESYLDLYRQAKGLQVVEVRSAAPLADGQRATLIKALEERYKRGVVLRETVDETLIGGLQIHAQGDFIDSSLKHRLRQIHARLGLASIKSGEFYED